ncbi:GT4 family glycosyltransferase PelF [Rhizomonospora bruguierae]|uniref:GT4 family glycosyltransferase PelF n=1 Tax=Rhizomonospora bruguierae TaxID=1581705 RepID=UPI001BD14C0E|nr:GT4 family glycosyltransferase PelF [Micromonospora sp. NBRC 107566]
MRIALLTEATYPYARSGVGAWCQRLCTGLSHHEYEVVSVTGTAPGGAGPAYRTPGNVAALRSMTVTASTTPPGGRLSRARHRRAGAAAATLLSRGLVGDGPRGTAMFRDGLRRLADLAPAGHPLHGVPVAEILTDAWRAAGAASTEDTGDFTFPLPPLSPRDAQRIAVLLDHAVRPLAAPPPEVDLCHAVGAGLPLLVALAAKWRAGTPFLLTEHGIYLRERYLTAGDPDSPAVRAAVLRFYRTLSRLGYAEAAAIATASRFNRRWELRHGAHPAKIAIVPNGLDPAAYPPLPEAGGPPTVGWVGRIGPDRDLHTLIEAFARVRGRVPGARLRLYDPVEEGPGGYAEGCHDLIARRGLGAAVTVTGPVRTSVEAYADSHVAVLGTVAEGAPYPVIEAMMCGRATVGADVGAVAETVGEAGLVVPPGDPDALAAACTGLLLDPRLRHRLATAARRRAVEHFAMDRMLDAYDDLYRGIRSPGRAQEPTLALPFAPGAA